ncbi:MAG: hypothetical protein PHS14_00340 [Elusimicrobia bacterium]|nr:hypothetical protein [Elusimicrobiota bacterium]
MTCAYLAGRVRGEHRRALRAERERDVCARSLNHAGVQLVAKDAVIAAKNGEIVRLVGELRDSQQETARSAQRANEYLAQIHRLERRS